MSYLQFKLQNKSIGKEFDGSSPRIPQGIINSQSVVYSFGAGEDIRYEYVLCAATNCEMHIFDPTPRSIEHYKLCQDVLYNNVQPFEDQRFGRGDPNYFESILASKTNNELKDKMNYHSIALYDCEDTFKFYYPKNRNHVSLSIDNMQKTNEFIELPTKSIDQIIKDFKLRPPNVLKMNIEGAEVKSLRHMMEKTDIRPECIAVMFELYRDKPTPENKILEDETKSLIEKEYDLIYRRSESHTYLKKNLKTKELKNLNMETKNESETQTTSFEGGNIHLIVQYYNDSNPERQAELDFCVQANLENPHVINLHNLTEPSTIVPEWLSSHSKYVECRVDNWLTYKTAIDYANDNLPNQNVALTNLDIFFSPNSKWNEMKQFVDNNVVLCLSRFEYDGEGSAKKDEQLQRLAFANCQDTWVWKSPIKVNDCDFMMGRLGCDNAIADRFKNSGYFPLNSPNQFATLHYDLCRGKTFENQLKMQKPNPERPEEKGYYLVPDVDSVPSCDHVMEQLGLGPLHKYQVICDVMSRYIKINNSPEKIKEMVDALEEKTQ